MAKKKRGTRKKSRSRKGRSKAGTRKKRSSKKRRGSKSKGRIPLKVLEKRARRLNKIVTDRGGSI